VINVVLKKEKMNGIVQRELSEILQTEVRDREIGFCTITAVDITNDLSIAKVYVSFLDKGYNNAKGMEALQRSKGFIRSLLAKRLTTRKVPELKFMLDTSLDYGNKIETIIRDLQQEDKD
jgi:ribosome-binding factor A